MGRGRAKGRNVNGILLLDKPEGISSNAALQHVKRLFNATKAGHTGSLDPMATGMLPICLGEATKISGFLLDADKRYRCTCQLGIKTSSGDREGEVLERRPVGSYSQQRVSEVLAGFVGEIQQIPPMYSAIKRQGVPLYKLAHQGIEIEREPRSVTIHNLDLVSQTKEQLELAVHCSKGTYVRTLAEDIGEQLGCGAHLVQLRRTEVGSFAGQLMHTFDELQAVAEQGLGALDALLLPVECALEDWPDIKLTDDAAFYLRRGQAVFVPQGPTSGLVRLFTQKCQFLGIGQILDDGRVAPKRMMVL